MIYLYSRLCFYRYVDSSNPVFPVHHHVTCLHQLQFLSVKFLSLSNIQVEFDWCVLNTDPFVLTLRLTGIMSERIWCGIICLVLLGTISMNSVKLLLKDLPKLTLKNDHKNKYFLDVKKSMIIFRPKISIFVFSKFLSNEKYNDFHISHAKSQNYWP